MGILVGSLARAGTDLVLSGHTAASHHGLCADSVYHTELMAPMPEFNGVRTPLLSYTERLFFDEEDVRVIESMGIRYTGLRQTLMDMMNSENDIARTDEALENYYNEEGGLEAVRSLLDYCLEHGLSPKKLFFGLEDLAENYEDISELVDDYKSSLEL